MIWVLRGWECTGGWMRGLWQWCKASPPQGGTSTGAYRKTDLQWWDNTFIDLGQNLLYPELNVSKTREWRQNLARYQWETPVGWNKVSNQSDLKWISFFKRRRGIDERTFSQNPRKQEKSHHQSNIIKDASTRWMKLNCVVPAFATGPMAVVANLGRRQSGLKKKFKSCMTLTPLEPTTFRLAFRSANHYTTGASEFCLSNFCSFSIIFSILFGQKLTGACVTTVKKTNYLHVSGWLVFCTDIAFVVADWVLGLNINHKASLIRTFILNANCAQTDPKHTRD